MVAVTLSTPPATSERLSSSELANSWTRAVISSTDRSIRSGRSQSASRATRLSALSNSEPTPFTIAGISSAMMRTRTRKPIRKIMPVALPRR